MKAYLRQQEEIKRQQQLIERFKHKPSKASFARSRKKLLELSLIHILFSACNSNYIVQFLQRVKRSADKPVLNAGDNRNAVFIDKVGQDIPHGPFHCKVGKIILT